MSKRTSSDNFSSLWPSFVDVMSNLLILMLFMVVIFMLLNFVSTVSRPDAKDKRIEELQNLIAEKNKVNQALIKNIRGIKEDLKKVEAEKEDKESDMEELYSVLDMAKVDAKKKDVKNEQLSAKVDELNMLILQMEGDIIKKDDVLTVVISKANYKGGK